MEGFENCIQKVWIKFKIFKLSHSFIVWRKGNKSLFCVQRYASLYFCCAIEQGDNELLTLEIIHRYVELLDKYFGSVSWNIQWFNYSSTMWLTKIVFQVCELDIIFNFEKAYFILDELLLGGEVQETSKKNVLRSVAAQDLLQEVSSKDEPPYDF